MNSKTQDNKNFDLTGPLGTSLDMENNPGGLRSFGVRSSKGLSLRPTRSLVKGKSVKPMVILPKNKKV